MKLVIGSMDRRMQQLIQRIKLTDQVTVVNKMCNIKLIKVPVDVIIPYGVILNNGLISNTLVHLEELLITLDVLSLTYGNISNKTIIEKLCEKYNVPNKYENIDLLRHI